MTWSRQQRQKGSIPPRGLPCVEMKGRGNIDKEKLLEDAVATLKRLIDQNHICTSDDPCAYCAASWHMAKIMVDRFNLASRGAGA